MGKIVVLGQDISNKIAAGEVVDKPASVVKELVENSIDAKATTITVEIKGGGISFIRVTDNGVGIDEDDTVVAFERHATSKIRQAEDLNSISTLGFRGEALASIAAVSQVELITKTYENMTGTLVEVNGGIVAKKEEIGCPNGTTIVVKNIFFNTPARLKFLKKESTEAGTISDLVERLALTHPEISFKLINNSQTIIHTPGNGDTQTTVLSVFGKDIAKAVVPINFEQSGVKITGLVGRPEVARANRNYQCIFINRRYIKSKLVSSALDLAYKTMLTVNKFPVAVLYIDIDPTLVDVNVHPTKMEVRFDNEEVIYNFVSQAVSAALKNNILIPQIILSPQEVKKDEIKQANKSVEKIESLFPSVSESFKKSEQPQQSQVNEKKEEYKPQRAEIKPVEKITEKTLEQVLKPSQPTVLRTFEMPKPIEKPVELPKEYLVQQSIEQVEKVEHLAPLKENEQEQVKISKNYKIVGQLFSTYIIIDIEEKMFVIDQHAAHERLKYNNLVEKYQKSEAMTQRLLSPLVVELSFNELKKVEENKELFEKLGYEIEEFGESTYLIRSVPYVLGQNYAKEFFIEIIDTLSRKRVANVLDLREEILFSMACKSAIKAYKVLSQNEIEKLVEDVLAMEDAFTCPHGRPIIISISKYEIEKMFKRVQ